MAALTFTPVLPIIILVFLFCNHLFQGSYLLTAKLYNQEMVMWLCIELSAEAF